MRTDRVVGTWLLACAGLVLLMVVVGGITRLTHSGLSITEWRPVTGAIPPLDDDAWRRALEAYRQTPEHRFVHRGIELPAFQRLYLIEWGHRFLGRFAGLVVVVPAVLFALRGRLPGRRGKVVLAVALLFALQGFVGWWMVASGLSSVPRVSPLRLAAHLLMASAIFVLLLGEGLASRGAPTAEPALRNRARAVAGLLLVTMAWGAFVAGLSAGHVCPTFPSMCGFWVPQPVRSPFTDAWTVQWVHRVLAGTTAIGALLVGVPLARSAAAPIWARAVGGALPLLVLIQATLGVTTVLFQVPLALAVVHQAFAFVLLGSLVALARH
ncbi:MAG: COX15/CtaA family protein [Myxococcales bacterium]|nr:COX15/CtaA family protein [Myxococcales bacterium]